MNLKTVFTISALSLLNLVASPMAQAGTVNPMLFAHQYCMMREYGMGRDKAIDEALFKSYFETGREAPVVTTPDGRTGRLDILRTWDRVKKDCPEYLEN